MKIVFTFFMACIAVIPNAQKPAKKTETIVSDLNNDRHTDTITLYTNLEDSLYFNKIAISLAGFGKQSFRAKNRWTKVDSGFLASNKNAANTNHLFLYKAKKYAIILVFGVIDGAGYREDFSIINIKNNKAFMAFDKEDSDPDIEIPVTVTDMDNDGRPEFIFRNYSEIYEHIDSLNADIGTYNPYLVQTIGDTCVLNKPLTRQYNEDHYVFAGYTYSEKIKVLSPRDKKKKPRVIE